MADDGRDWHGSLVELLSTMPGLTARLRADHTPDDAGRCRACRTPGTGTPRAQWPCQLASLAREAEQLAADRERDG